MDMKGMLLVSVAIGFAMVGAGTPAAGRGGTRTNLFADGGFVTGCNYWASHAGMYMWRKWDGAQVKEGLTPVNMSE